MTELGVTLVAIGAWVLAAGAAGFVGSFVAQYLHDRQAAGRVAEDRFDPSGVERPVTANSGAALPSAPASVLVPAASTAA